MPSDLTTPTPSEPLELRGLLAKATSLPWMKGDSAGIWDGDGNLRDEYLC